MTSLFNIYSFYSFEKQHDRGVARVKERGRQRKEGRERQEGGRGKGEEGKDKGQGRGRENTSTIRWFTP